MKKNKFGEIKCACGKWFHPTYKGHYVCNTNCPKKISLYVEGELPAVEYRIDGGEWTKLNGSKIMKHWIVIDVQTKRITGKQIARESILIEPGNSREGLDKLRGALVRANNAIKKDKKVDG